MATGKTIGRIKTSKLVELYGDTIEVRQSTRENAKYPFYLSTNCGPLPCNTPRAQDFLQDHATTIPDTPLEKKPETPVETPKAEPEKKPEPAPEKPTTTKEDESWLVM